MAEKQEKQNQSTISEIVDNLTLMDDDLMSRVFDKNIPATELLLRTILGREDIEVISVVGQRELKNPMVDGRTIRLDIVAKEQSGRMSDIEVQKESKGAHPRRARFHSSVLDSRMLKAGQEFNELADSHTIFITEEDYFKTGKPVYTIHRYVEENGDRFQDGSHIIYVNGEYDGDDALGKLMSDFKCKNPKNMHYQELAEGVKHFKEGGRNEMSQLVENYAREYAEEYAQKYAADIMIKIKKAEAEREKVEAEKEKVEAEKEKVEAEKEKVEAKVEELRARLAKYETV